ncbi:MAG: alpha/beta fold hydrolase [Phycisphaerales bacterium]
MLTESIAAASVLLSALLCAGAQSPAETPLPRRAGPLGLRLGSADPGPVVVEAVQPGSPAAKAGLQGGCTLRAVNGTPIAGREALREAMRSVRGGETVQLLVSTGDQPARTVAVTAEAASESLVGSTVTYGSVRVPAGYRLRTIVTEPRESPLAKDGKLPAFLYVSGIICDTVDRPTMPDAPDTRIVHAMADAGFVTMRVDKPGVGDSEGPPCSEIDLQTELAGYAAALRQLAAMPGVDPGRVYVFGHSMGGVLAPYLAKEVPVRGTVVYGTIVRTWFEYQLENVRRQSAMAPGVSEADVTDAVLAEAKSSAMVLVEKKTLGDAWARWPELRQPTDGVMLDENHMSTRSMAFFHQLQDLNLARAWQESSGAVLAVYGEYDWVTSEADQRKIADIVNARAKGAGTAIVRPQADHAFTTHPSMASSRALMGGGAFDRGLPQEVLRWIASVEGRTFVEPAEPGGAPATELRAWQRLPAEPYPGKQDDIFFVNERVGWYGNGAGKVFRTEDGGDTWIKTWEKPGTFVRCLAFVDEKVGVLGNIGPGYFPGVTDPVPVYRTEDGGSTWTPVTAIDGPPVTGLCAFDIVQVPFINAGKLDRRTRIVGVGRVGGPAAYIWSDDLGRTWKQGKLPDIAAMAFDVRFLDEERGFIASASNAQVNEANAVILATEDGGDTWEEVYRSSRPWETTWKFAFPDSETGYCTIQSYNPDPGAKERFVAKTLDGGRSWYELPLTEDHAVREFGIAFLDADTGWVGAVPHGFVTTDGGATWHDADIGNAVNKIRLLRTEAGVTGFAIGTEVRRMRLPQPPDPAPAPEVNADRPAQ